MNTKTAHSTFWQSSETIIIVTILLCIGLERFVYSLGNIPLPDITLYSLGFIIIVTGIILIVLASINMKKFNQPTAPGLPTTKIVTHGIFRFSRNPLYLGVVISLQGIGIVFNNLWFLVFLIPTIVTFNKFLIKPEESYLVEIFGEEYSTYMNRVRRWL